MMLLPYTFYVVRMHLGIVRVSVSADRLLANFVTRRPHWRWPYLVYLLLPENNCFFTRWNSTGTKILANSDDYSSKTHRIRSKQVSFDSTRFTLQVHTKNMQISLKSHVLHRKTLFSREFRQLNRAKVTIYRTTRRIC